MAVGHEAEVADAMEAIGQRVKQEATDELLSSESHRTLLTAAGVVFPGKSNVAIFKCQQTVVEMATR